MGVAMHLMVDEEGESWPASSPEFLRRLGEEQPNFDAVDHAIRNLGYIGIRQGHNSVRITCRPEFVSPVSIVGLRYLLVDLGAHRVALTLFSESSRTEIVSSIEDAIARIEALARHSRRGLAKTPLDLATIEPTRRLRFHTLLNAWRECSGVVETLPAEILERADVVDRSVTIRLADDGRLWTLAVGVGLSVYGPRWNETAVGRPFDDQPDRRYAAWVHTDYLQAMVSSQPVFHFIDATVASEPNQRRRFVYERLILPWRTKGGDVLASSFSIRRPAPATD